jgi:hypothetical protein
MQPEVNVVTRTWVVAILLGLGVKAIKSNADSLKAWIISEKGWLWDGLDNNPLNCTQVEPGDSNKNSAGVKNYPSFLEGRAATISTLIGKMNYYPTLVKALQDANIELFFSSEGMKEIDKWGTSSTLVKQVYDIVKNLD